MNFCYLGFTLLAPKFLVEHPVSDHRVEIGHQNHKGAKVGEDFRQPRQFTLASGYLCQACASWAWLWQIPLLTLGSHYRSVCPVKEKSRSWRPTPGLSGCDYR